MQQQESDNDLDPNKSASSVQTAPAPSEQQPLQDQPNLLQRLWQAVPFALQLVKIIARAGEQDSVALQIEAALVQGLEQLKIAEQSIQLFKDRLAKMRQRTEHARHEDIYVLGGILIYCGILLPVLISLGVPDFSARIAWLAFAVSGPSTVGFFLARFLKKSNQISRYGRLHSTLAFLAEVGVIVITASLFFHIWNIAGWVFLLCTLALIFGYQGYRWNIYYRPFLSIFKAIVKKLSEGPPAPM